MREMHEAVPFLLGLLAFLFSVKRSIVSNSQHHNRNERRASHTEICCEDAAKDGFSMETFLHHLSHNSYHKMSG